MKLSSPSARAGAREFILALWLFVFALVVAGWLRFPELGMRPMHTDETTQAIKFRHLLEGKYEYDPVEHHGPTLLFSTLPVKWFSSAESFVDMTEAQLRLVPLLYCMGLIVLLPLLGGGMGRLAVGFGALLLAVSPLFVYFSRYYIMEMLLVFFTFTAIASGWRFYQNRSMLWLVVCAASFGLMHATKETFVLHVIAMAGAAAFVFLTRNLRSSMVVNRNRPDPITKRHWLVFFGVAALSSVLCFTIFFTKPAGAVDSVKTYLNYLNRAGGQGHEKPAIYYTKLLVANKGGHFWLSEQPQAKPTESKETTAPESSPQASPTAAAKSNTPFWIGLSASPFWWTEALVLVLAAVGILRSFLGRAVTWNRELMIFLSIYSVLNFLAYSFISYKTPWCILSAHHGFIIMAGFGAAGLFSLFETTWGKLGFIVVLLVGCAHLALQCHRSNFQDNPKGPRWLRTLDTHSNVGNPYAYGFTPVSLKNDIVAKLRGYAERHPDGRALRVEIATQSGGWPLPWYLRDFTKVAYLSAVNDPKRPLDPTADVIIVDNDMTADLPESVRGADWNGSAEYCKHIQGPLNQQFWVRGYVKRNLVPNAPPPPTPPPSTPEPIPTDATPATPPPHPETPPPAPDSNPRIILPKPPAIPEEPAPEQPPESNNPTPTNPEVPPPPLESNPEVVPSPS